MSTTAENLLNLIASTTGHPFNFLEISSDYSSITTFSGKGVQPRIVYSNKKQYLEVLAREIFLNTYLRDEKNYYIEEKIDSDSDSYRSDLITKLHGDNAGKQNIIEFKEMKSDINTAEFRNQVENAFSQVKNKYISEKDGDIFVSVVFMDVEKIVKSPINLEKFITVHDKEKMKDQFNKNSDPTMFKKFGISVITKKFLKAKDTYADRTWFHIPKHCLIEINHAEKDAFDMPQKVANIKDATRFPTSSSCYGIKNVRDIKDPSTSDQKKNLLLEIMTTSVDAFTVNDSSLVNKYGKEKDFVFIRDESIVKKYVHKDIVYYSLTTMNGAIIDGQNSIDCFKIILDFIDTLISKKKGEFPKYYDKMEKILAKASIDSDHLRGKFKKFVEDLQITIKTTETDSVQEAVNIAVNKNNTMPVSSNELTISRNSESIHIIGNEILEKSDIILGYPKRQYYGVSEDLKGNSVVACDELAKACQVYKEIQKSPKFQSDRIFAYKSKMVTSNAKKAISEFCNDYSKPVIDYNSIVVKKIDSKIDLITEEINNLSIRKDAIMDFGNKDEIADMVESLQESINEKKTLLKDWKKQKEVESTSTFEAVNTQELINISHTILRIKWYVKNIDQFVPSEILDVINVSKDNTLFCYCYILLLRNYKALNFKSKPIKDSSIQDVVVKFFNNYYDFCTRYPINITVLNHNQNPDAKTTRNDDKEMYLSEVCDELFKVD